MAGWVTSMTRLGCLNRQECEKGYIFTKILNKTVPERVHFTVWHSKRGMIFQFKGHSNRVVFFRDAGRTCLPNKSLNATFHARGLSLPRKSVVRLTDRHDMTILVDWGVKPQSKQNIKTEHHLEIGRMQLFYYDQITLLACRQ